jgi:hypothetical protein
MSPFGCPKKGTTVGYTKLYSPYVSTYVLVLTRNYYLSTTTGTNCKSTVSGSNNSTST